MKKHDLDKQKASPRTCIPIPKQSNDKRKQSHQMNIPSQTIPTNPILPSIQKDPKTASTYRHRLLKQNPKLRNSISSKEDFRNKNGVGPPIQLNLPTTKKLSKKKDINIYSNQNVNPHNTPQMTGNSNCVLTTNYSDKEEDKKTIKNTKQEITLNSLKHLGNLFRSSNFKQTIIIDDEGNNNLNIDLKQLNNRKTFIKNNFECNPLAVDQNTPKNEMPIKISYQNYNNHCINNNQPNTNINTNYNSNSNTNMNQGDNNRLNEYKMIFNLLNSNIDQMKNIIQKNIIINPNLSNNATINSNVNSYTNNKLNEPLEISNRIISQKDIEEINKITNNDPPTNITTNTIAVNDNSINNIKVNNNNSFLDSCINEDFYQSFVMNNMHKNTQDFKDQKLSLSFEYSTILPKNEIINNKHTILNVNLNEQTECENYEEEGRDNMININTITPHFLLHKANTFSHKNIKPKSREPSFDAKDKNKCFIF